MYIYIYILYYIYTHVYLVIYFLCTDSSLCFGSTPGPRRVGVPACLPDMAFGESVQTSHRLLGKLFNSLDSEFRCNTGMYSRAEVCGIHIPCKPYNGVYTSHIP